MVDQTLLNAPQVYASTKLLLMTAERRKHGVGMASKDIIFTTNSVEIGLLHQKLKWGSQTRTHAHTQV